MVDRWFDVPCRRYRCPGHLRPQEMADDGYYRRFYRQGRTRRVVTEEHTGLLSRRDREAVETAFKAGTAPDAPNVLTATPTLEMGIDIGDLSAVMLTSVPRNPASYIQRVGRAGRATGNALVTTFVRSDTHGLYYLAEPEAMLAGVVRPPNCYLEATETLERQYVAYLMDRIADGALDAPAVHDPHRRPHEDRLRRRRPVPSAHRRLDQRTRPRRAVPRPVRDPPRRQRGPALRAFAGGGSNHA